MVTVRLYTCSFIVSFRLRFGRTVVERAAIGQRALRVPCYPFPCRTVCGIDGWCCATMRRNALRRRRRRRGAHATAPPRRLCQPWPMSAERSVDVNQAVSRSYVAVFVWCTCAFNAASSFVIHNHRPSTTGPQICTTCERPTTM